MDKINALFELAGAVFLLPSLLLAMKTKIVQGVHWLTPTFFWSWGVWNTIYYPFLDQWWSFLAGMVLVVVNTFWLYSVIRYTPK